jgi:hypothetical protein
MMHDATGKSPRHDLLNDLNTLRLACEAIALPIGPGKQLACLDDLLAACESIGDRLDELFGPLPVRPDRVAPCQWMMDQPAFLQA